MLNFSYKTTKVLSKAARLGADDERFFQQGSGDARLGLFVAERILADHGGNLLVSEETPLEKAVSVILFLGYRRVLQSPGNGWVGKARLVAE